MTSTLFMTAPRDYRQHLEVETPEHVVIDYEIAGLGSRALAALADMFIIVTLGTAVAWLAGRVTASAAPVVFPVIGLLFFGLLWGYFTLFEGLREGQTPGKRWLGIRVIRDTGHAIAFREAAARNLLRLIDFLPPPYLSGALFVAFHPKGKRIGDLVAGTVVVRDRPIGAPVPSPLAFPGRPRPTTATEVELAAPAGESGAEVSSPLLTDEEFRFLREFDARARDLPAEVRRRLASQLVARLASRFPSRPADDVAFLGVLMREEGSRRRGRFGSRVAAAGAAGGPARATTSVMERLVARKDSRWQEFGALAARAARGGFDSLGASELPGFAARYREVASDLARARTYGADPVVRVRLERLVAAGHNLLYRDERRTWGRIFRFFAVEAPASVIAARRVVLVAFLAFALPALGGYATLREDPSLAEAVIPSVLLERAEEGAARHRAGKGYAEVPAGQRLFVASQITTNNLGVAFACFAGGVVLGIGSLVSLAFNGLLMGAASGHYANVGLLSYLWTFVAGHGVLELFAIWCAGAAGFLLGIAVLRPGGYSRRDALVVNARLSMRLVGFCVVLLLVAGSIEGFFSTSSAPPPVKVAVSIASAALLTLYLANGARFAHELSDAERGSPVDAADGDAAGATSRGGGAPRSLSAAR